MKLNGCLLVDGKPIECNLVKLLVDSIQFDSIEFDLICQSQYDELITINYFDFSHFYQLFWSESDKFNHFKFIVD